MRLLSLKAVNPENVLRATEGVGQALLEAAAEKRIAGQPAARVGISKNRSWVGWPYREWEASYPIVHGASSVVRLRQIFTL